jgi:hypothetical protein
MAGVVVRAGLGHHDVIVHNSAQPRPMPFSSIGAVQNANRPGAANAPNTRELVIAPQTTGIAIYSDDQRLAGKVAREALEKQRKEEEAYLAAMREEAARMLSDQEETADEEAVALVGETRFSDESKKYDLE